MMTEQIFKVGDKVRILDASKIKEALESCVITNGVYDVDYIYSDGTPSIITPTGRRLGFYHKEMQFIENATEKPTKKQRIEALESQAEKQAEQIAELQYTIAKLREALA